MNFFQPQPNRLHAGLAITLAAKESAKACNQAQHLVQAALVQIARGRIG